jgi:hypothetical protein
MLGLPWPDHRAEQARSDAAHKQRGWPMERGPACAQCGHGAARSVQGTLKARDIAWLMVAHRWLISG